MAQTMKAFERHSLAMHRRGTTIWIEQLSSGNVSLTLDSEDTHCRRIPTCKSSGRHLSATLCRNSPKHKPSQLPLTTPLQNQLRNTKRFSKPLATPPLLKPHLGRRCDIMLVVCKLFHRKTSLIELKTDY